jgi:hypothetical protein
VTRADVISKLSAAGVNATPVWLLLDSDYEPVSLERVREIANACLDSLPPELITYRDIAGVRVRKPLWVEEAGDCETHSIILWAWAMVGNWLRAVRTREKRGGLAFGFLLYVAEPRAENGYRNGRHCICWFIDHAGAVRFFEFGDNDETTLTSNELLTIFGGGAA